MQRLYIALYERVIFPHKGRLRGTQSFVLYHCQKSNLKVIKFSRKIFCLQESIEFQQTALETTLQLVYSIIWELKTHEIIENTVIMQVRTETILEDARCGFD